MLETKKYPWPASQLSREEMHLLVRARQRYNKPITALIREAIREQYGDET